MTTKNIKTILFASLIAAMILPFSMTGMVTAQTSAQDTQNADDIQKLKDYKKELKQEIKNTKDKEKKKEFKVVSKRISLVIELLELDSNSTTPQVAAQSTNEQRTEADIIAEIDATFDYTQENAFRPIDNQTESTEPQTAASTVVNWQTSTKTKFNCNTISYDSGYNWGTLVGLDLLESYFVAVQGYPATIYEMDNNYCTQKSFTHGYVVARNLSTGGFCDVNFTHANDAESGYCWEFGVGAPVLISANADYGVWNPFSTEGYKFLWVPA
ncbi:MAG: hypothetical protein MAG458_00275 [Nitrosopumilus sp.]|nr:hypothetical protein [Nitrosopumilus sp.]